MSLDRRLREGLERSSAGIEPNVEDRLPVVVKGSRRRVRLRRAGYAATALVAIVVIAIVAPRLIDVARNSEPPQPANSGHSVQPYAAISGTYTATLDAGNAAVSRNGEAGRWTLTIQRDRALRFSPPASFIKVPSASAFRLAGHQFTTNAFYNGVCNSVGEYVWSLEGGRLRFTPVRDACELRRVLLSAQPWQRLS